ncbi:DNA polymerase III subunit gamma/tau, partial [Serratia marcescens]
MSYQVLARKWRPQTFADVVGQEHVLTALANGLSLGRIHHAYLFSGTRGVGKTTIARLLAKGLNCETGITATPCGQCDNCREIEQGRFVDLIEIDAASRTKVEDTRDLLDNVQYAPARGRFKVYLIDEVHMLSRHSFNALLKTLEEPPPHVKFLLATTDPQKLPVTILSRCLQFHLKALDVDQIRQQLETVLTAEQITSDARALQLLARAADGSMRDALSLTDQAIAMGQGQVTAATVSQMLGTLDDEQPLAILEALVSADGEKMMAQVAQAASRGVDWENLLVETLALLHRIAMVQLLPSMLD